MSGRSARFLPILFVLVAACGFGTPPRALPGRTPSSLPAAVALTPVPQSDGGSSGVSLVPLSIEEFIFGPSVAVSKVQPESGILVGLIKPNKRLHIGPLPSPPGTAAMDFVEDSTPDLRWGELMWPAQRKVFSAFAADPSLGEWLVIVDDVNVEGGSDPIPVTAYRWPRSAVEDYARCGIPPDGIDDCTSEFYTTSEVLFVMRPSQSRGQ